VIQLINNHVLIPNPANWEKPPSWSRRWQTAITPAVSEHESRVALRANPLVSLMVTVSTWTGASGSATPAQNRLDDRISAASKTGLVCVPYWGRGSVLSQDCSADFPYLNFTVAHWPWATGDYVFFSYDNFGESYEVRRLIGLTRNGFQLDQAPAETIEAGTICWPLLYGKFSSDTMPAETAQRGSIAFTISEQASPKDASIGAFNLPVLEGIGGMTINEDFFVDA